jgi:hypothetical protein
MVWLFSCRFSLGHTRPIVLLGFKQRILPMVTMDDELNVLLWQYDLAHFSGFGWCVLTV